MWIIGMHSNTELTDHWSLHKTVGQSHFKQLSEDNVQKMHLLQSHSRPSISPASQTCEQTLKRGHHFHSPLLSLLPLCGRWLGDGPPVSYVILELPV